MDIVSNLHTQIQISRFVFVDLMMLPFEGNTIYLDQYTSLKHPNSIVIVFVVPLSTAIKYFTHDWMVVSVMMIVTNGDGGDDDSDRWWWL